MRELFLAAVAPMVWGTTYLVTTELLPPDRPLLAATLRALPAGLMITVALRRLPKGEWRWRMPVLGILNIGLFFGLLFAAAYRLPGGVAATAGAVQPLIAASLAALLLSEPLRPITVAAGLMGMAGVGLLVLGPGAALDPLGVAAALGGAVSMATGVVLTKKWGRPSSLLAATGWQLLAGGLALLPVTLVVEGLPSTLTLANVAGFAWLAIVGTALAYTIWFRGVERLPVTTLTLLGLASPLTATAAGWLILGQSLTPAQLVGMAAVLAAIALPHLPRHVIPVTRPRRAALSEC